ncbi:MAG: sigma-70 family RNA polymerase sigma factor [Kiritimatiellae bacterium]|nr:sigma-70 family RNA polymerase sigma factor [Kiritimatiellia bacterium]
MDEREYELLQTFVRTGSEAAFTELANRYAGLVQGAAMRMLGDHHLAEDAVQVTLVILARKAAELSRKVMLGSWLWQTATLVCRNMKRTEARRKRREAAAVVGQEIAMALRSEAKRAWAAVQPYLDEGLARLPAKPREALVARYLVGKSTREIARELGIRENTVAVRIHTGVRRLRAFFDARGVRVSGGLLIVLLGRETAAAAPAALPGAVAAAAAGAEAAKALTPAARLLLARALRAMLWAKVKVAAVSTAGAVAAVGAVTYVAPLVIRHSPPAPPAAAPTMPVPPAPARSQTACYLIRGGDVMRDFPAFAERDDVAGVQKGYTWRHLERSEGVYDFTEIETDLARLKAHGKRLMLHVAYNSGRPDLPPGAPDYVRSDARYGGSSTYHGSYERPVGTGGWLLCIWHPQVRARVTALYAALGKRFEDEPAVEGVVLPQTSTGRPERGYGYTVGGEMQAFKELALAAQRAFPDKVVLQTINAATFKLSDYTAWVVDQGIGLNCFFLKESFDWGRDMHEAHRLCAAYRTRVPIAIALDYGAFQDEPEPARTEHMRQLYRKAFETVAPRYILVEWRQKEFAGIVAPLVRKMALTREVAADIYDQK